MGDRSPSIQHARSSQQERAGTDRSDATCLFGTPSHPIDQRGIGNRGVDARSTGDHQCIQRCRNAREQTGCDPQSRRCRHALPAFRDHPKNVRRCPSGLRDVIVGGCEHLKRPGDIEQLHRGIGKHFDDARRMAASGDNACLTHATGSWRGTRGLWHFRQSLPGRNGLVHGAKSHAAGLAGTEGHLAITPMPTELPCSLSADAGRAASSRHPTGDESQTSTPPQA